MPGNASLGTSLGFQLGATGVSPLVAGLAITKSGVCLPYLALSVSAAGLVRTSGTCNLEVAGNSRLGRCLGFPLGSHVDLLAVRPQSVLGTTFAKQGPLVAALSVVAAGRVVTGSRMSAAIKATALGIATTSGQITVDVRLQGLTGTATTRGSAVVLLKVTALGAARASGSIAAVVIHAIATAVGRTSTQGFMDHQSFSVPAVGRVSTRGAGTIPLSAGQVKCVVGPDGPGAAGSSARNAVY